MHGYTGVDAPPLPHAGRRRASRLRPAEREWLAQRVFAEGSAKNGYIAS